MHLVDMVDSGRDVNVLQGLTSMELCHQLCACASADMHTPGAARPQGSWERSGHVSTATSTLVNFPASPSCSTGSHGMARHSFTQAISRSPGIPTQAPAPTTQSPRWSSPARETITLRQLRETRNMQTGSLHGHSHFVKPN